jgi:hypothetical protein
MGSRQRMLFVAAGLAMAAAGCAPGGGTGHELDTAVTVRIQSMQIEGTGTEAAIRLRYEIENMGCESIAVFDQAEAEPRTWDCSILPTGILEVSHKIEPPVPLPEKYLLEALVTELAPNEKKAWDIRVSASDIGGAMSLALRHRSGNHHLPKRIRGITVGVSFMPMEIQPIRLAGQKQQRLRLYSNMDRRVLLFWRGEWALTTEKYGALPDLSLGDFADHKEDALTLYQGQITAWSNVVLCDVKLDYGTEEWFWGTTSVYPVDLWTDPRAAASRPASTPTESAACRTRGMLKGQIQITSD